MSLELLGKMEAKLARIKDDFDNLNMNSCRNGHGGTPNITDNSKGRMMMRSEEKRQERLRSLHKQEKEQIEKIERMKKKIAFHSAVTKKAKAFIEKNEIHPKLFELEKQGLVKQWTRNPMYFFITGLERVALATFSGGIHPAGRFPTKNETDKARVIELINLTKDIELGTI